MGAAKHAVKLERHDDVLLGALRLSRKDPAELTGHPRFNIRSAALLVTSAESVTLGNTVVLAISLEDHPDITARGHVVWVSPLADGAYAVALRLSEILPSDFEALLELGRDAVASA
jgi:Tfp pilus assembly protein PilZ